MIPISNRGWNCFALRFARLVQESIPEASGMVAEAIGVDAFRDLRAVSTKVALVVESLDEAVLSASLFIHPTRQNAAIEIYEHVGQIAERWLRQLIGGLPSVQVPDSSRDLLDAMDGLIIREGRQETDIWQVAFGVSGSSVRDSDGRFSLPNLLAVYQSQLDELDNRVKRFLVPLGATSMEQTKALRFAVGVLDADDPAEYVQLALHVRQRIIEAYEIRPAETVSALSDLLGGVRESYQNWLRVREVVKRFNRVSADDVEERASLNLQYYLKVIEGQVRPWCWTLIRLISEGSGRTPMIGELLDRLRAADDPLAAEFAECIDPTARNAVAHEDYHWDPLRQTFVDREGVVLVAEVLATKAARGLALMSSAEFGWALACADLPALLAEIQPKGVPDVPTVLEVRDALNRFGTNGLAVEDWVQIRSELIVTVDGLVHDGRTYNENHSAQALVEACIWLPRIERFSVRTRRAGPAVLTAQRATLRAIRPAWFTARHRLRQMPTALFLPVFYETRLMLEAESSAIAALTSLALNEAALFAEELDRQVAAGRAVDDALDEYSFGISIVERSLEISAVTRETARELVLGRAYRALRGARTYADHAVGLPAGNERAESLRAMAKMMNKLGELAASMPSHGPLPPNVQAGP